MPQFVLTNWCVLNPPVRCTSPGSYRNGANAPPFSMTSQPPHVYCDPNIGVSFGSQAVPDASRTGKSSTPLAFGSWCWCAAVDGGGSVCCPASDTEAVATAVKTRVR